MCHRAGNEGISGVKCPRGLTAGALGAAALAHVEPSGTRLPPSCLPAAGPGSAPAPKAPAGLCAGPRTALVAPAPFFDIKKPVWAVPARGNAQRQRSLGTRRRISRLRSGSSSDSWNRLGWKSPFGSSSHSGAPCWGCPHPGELLQQVLASVGPQLMAKCPCVARRGLWGCLEVSGACSRAAMGRTQRAASPSLLLLRSRELGERVRPRQPG